MITDWHSATPFELNRALIYVKSLKDTAPQSVHILEISQALINLNVWQLETKRPKPEGEDLEFIKSMTANAPNMNTLKDALSCVYINDDLWIQHL